MGSEKRYSNALTPLIIDNFLQWLFLSKFLPYLGVCDTISQWFYHFTSFSTFAFYPPTLLPSSFNCAIYNVCEDIIITYCDCISKVWFWFKSPFRWCRMEKCNTEPDERLDEFYGYTQPDERLDGLCEEINKEGNMTVSITHGAVRRTLCIDDYVARDFSYNGFISALDVFRE